MTVGLAAAQANAMINALTTGTSYAGNAAYWVKLHTGDPGAAGTANAAVNTTRHQATFGSVASGGSIANTATITWIPAEVTTTENYTFWSAWTASTAGTFLASGTVSGGNVTAGSTFAVAIGACTVAITSIAA
jgi:hypothetical protein